MATTPPTPTPPPAPAGGGSPPPKGGGKIGEIFSTVSTVVGGLGAAAAAAGAFDGGKHAAAVARALANIHSDFQFASRHAGVNRAYWLNWFWQAWVVGVWLSISEVFLQGSHAWLGSLELAFLILQAYAWPVRSVSMFDHAAARQEVDRARALVLELREQRDAALLGRGPHRSLPFDPAALHTAEQDLVREQQRYQDWVSRQGANNRDPVFLTVVGWMLNAALGFTMIYTIMGNHGDGMFSYDDAFWPALRVCILPYVMFLTSAYVLSEVAPFVLAQVSKVDSLLTAFRRVIIAGLLIGPTYKDVVTEEVLAARLNGDDVNRTPTDILKRTVQIFLGVAMLKVTVAVVLALQHLLLLPSAIAFIGSVALAPALKGLENVFRSVNVHTELGPPWIRRGAALSFLLYAHMYFAGGAPREHMGLGWWFSDYGPFGPIFGRSNVVNTVDTVHGAGRSVAHGIGTPVARYGHDVTGLGLGGWLCWVIMGTIVVGILVLLIQKASKGVEGTSHALLKKIAFGIVLVVFAPIALGGIYQVLHTPTAIEQRRREAGERSSPARREIRRQAERYLDANDRSTAMTLAEGADELEGDNARRELARRCVKNAGGHPPCSRECYAHHGLRQPERMEAERELGYCYLR